jgi:Putative metallopeptidase
MLFVGFHEMGHALADQFHLPTLGRAEDAADSFATIALLDAGSEFSINVLVQAARGLFLSDRRDRKQREELDFSDAHGLDRQRAFQIICLMVGSDKEQFKELADWVRMPQDRRRSCAADYQDATYAWHSLLDSHGRADGQPSATIEIAYEGWPGKPGALREVVPVRRVSGSSVGLRVEPLCLATSDQDDHGKLRRRQCDVGFVSQH